MVWGLGVGIMIVGLFFALAGFVLFKETRKPRFWQEKVDEGDREMITQLVEEEVARWREERPPKGTPAAVWLGIQGVELIDIGRRHIRASTTAEPQFAQVGGQRRQVTSALDEGKRITARLVERFFYDIPHIRPDEVQIDLYTTFHEPGGEANQRCILSTNAHRQDAAEIDWENDAPEVIAEQLGARYDLDERGHARSIQPRESPATADHDGARSGP